MNILPAGRSGTRSAIFDGPPRLGGTWGRFAARRPPLRRALRARRGVSVDMGRGVRAGTRRATRRRGGRPLYHRCNTGIERAALELGRRAPEAHAEVTTELRRVAERQFQRDLFHAGGSAEQQAARRLQTLLAQPGAGRTLQMSGEQALQMPHRYPEVRGERRDVITADFTRCAQRFQVQRGRLTRARAAWIGRGRGGRAIARR